MKITLEERERWLSLLRQPNVCTFYITVLLSVSQYLVACSIQHWDTNLLLKACFLGAPLTQGLYVLSLEYSGNLCFGQEVLDRVGGIVGNLITGVPYAELVRYVDAEHRAFCHSKVYIDPHKPSETEIKVVQGAGMKIGYMCLYPIVYTYRLLFRHCISFTFFLLGNVLGQIGFNILIWYWYGFICLFYLWLSTYIGMCPLHPCASHLLLQHNRFDKRLERVRTYSYYGVVNIVTLNIGYHRERHAENRVPWTYLPLVKCLMGEQDRKVYYTSTIQAIHDFIFDSDIRLS